MIIVAVMGVAMTEDLCLRCGKCCLRKKKLARGYYYMKTEHCEHFKNGGCDIYYERLTTPLLHNQWCQTAAESLKLGLLPKSCVYVQASKEKYRSKLINDK